MRLVPLLVTLIIFAISTTPARADAVSSAYGDAIAAFEAARGQLPAEVDGVDVRAYGDALRTGRFTSAYWGGEIALEIIESGDNSGSCSRFAAYVRLPPQGGVIRLTLCQQFAQEGTPELRRLTLLHELVHVVAGPDECRAMAFAARIERLATGRHTPVDRYWQSNNCQTSGFRLP